MQPFQNKKNNSLYNLKPSKLLEKYIKKFKVGNALDIGCGGGRNSIFLASYGFNVDAVDKDKDAIKKLKLYLNKNKTKNIQPYKINILNFNFKPNYYTLIIAIHSLDFLKLSEIKFLIKKIKKSLKKDGIVYLSVFSTKEPIYQKLLALKKKKIEKNTFYIPRLKSYRHFFTIQEIKKFFQGYKIIFLRQKQKIDYHKDIGKHYHNVIEVIIKK